MILGTVNKLEEYARLSNSQYPLRGVVNPLGDWLLRRETGRFLGYRHHYILLAIKTIKFGN